MIESRLLMKTAVMLTTFCLMACGVAPVHAAGLAVLDMEALVRAHPNTEADRVRLNQTLRDYEAQGEHLRRRVEALQEALEEAETEAGNLALSERARTRARDAVDKARDSLAVAKRDLHERMQQLQKQLTEEELRLLNRTVESIRVEIAAYAARQGIKTVLDVSASRQAGVLSGVLYYHESLDITEKILEMIGSGTGGETP